VAALSIATFRCDAGPVETYVVERCSLNRFSRSAAAPATVARRAAAGVVSCGQQRCVCVCVAGQPHSRRAIVAVRVMVRRNDLPARRSGSGQAVVWSHGWYVHVATPVMPIAASEQTR